ncbi:MAG TPA: sulfatase [Candidatus Hydrogenedentes bacterium]|nr:sulfatase [Candidatus Hydrogenedentota bacterium]
MSTISRRSMLAGMGLALGGGLFARGAHGADKTVRRPNFVVIYCDDLGYGDLGCYGAEKIKTPRLDAMAGEGARFTDFYSCAAVCTPSRAGLLTARYPIRSGLNKVLFPGSTGGIEDSEITIAQALKALGYATGCIGKWHLGHLPPFLPTRHGFDYYFGLPYSNDMEVKARKDPPLPLMRNEEIVEQPANQDLLTKRYTEEAVRFIREHKDQPFFLYIPHSMPHVPLHVSDSFRGKSGGGLYGDVIEEIDWSVGQVLDAVKDCGIEENTLVIFSSDNGPWLAKGEHGGNAGPLRMGKGTTFEGGVREPGIFRWPGHIAAGRVEHAPAITLDLLPTFVALAGGTPPSDRSIDGQNIAPLLLGTGQPSSRDFFFYLLEDLQAMRSGPWKLKRPFKGSVYGKPEEHPVLLFNLENDPGEKNNVAEQHPDIVKQLEERMQAFEKGLGAVPETKK